MNVDIEKLRRALEYQRKTYPVFGVVENGKKPTRIGWQQEATLDEPFAIREFRDGRSNIGVKTGDGLCVLDIDRAEMIAPLMERFRDRITTEVATPRGGRHLYFAGDLRNSQNDGFDVRGDGGFVLGAGSVVAGKRYELLSALVPKHELKPFPVEILPRRSPVERQPDNDVFRRINRARAYGQKVFAVSGSGGHNATFRFVCFMRDLGLSPTEAYSVLLEWNDGGNAIPKWDMRSLTHKIESSYAEAKK